MKALVVNDDRVLADLVAFAMRREGFQVSLAYDGEIALSLTNAGHVLTYDAIITQVWGVERADRYMLRQLVSRLLSKLEPARPIFIETVLGLGYGLTMPAKKI